MLTQSGSINPQILLSLQSREMAGFHTKTFDVHDDYMTPKSAWEAIQQYLPKDKIIWEAFYGDGNSGKYLQELGFQVIHKKIDFFEANEGEVVVSNPPFSKANDVLARLKELNKPFMLLMPCSKLNTSYVRTLFGTSEDKLQLIIPRKRIQFTKLQNGKTLKENKCNFDCFYYCWKLDLPRDIVWLV